MSTKIFWLAAGLLAMLATYPGEAGAVAAPDSAELTRWRSALAGSHRLYVRTPGGRLVLSDARLTSAGVLGLAASGNAVTHAYAPLEPRLVEWSEVSSVDRLQTNVGRGIKWGMAAGLVVGVIAATQVEPDSHSGVLLPGAPPAAVQRAVVLTFTPLFFGFCGGVAGAFLPTWHRAIP